MHCCQKGCEYFVGKERSVAAAAGLLNSFTKASFRLPAPKELKDTNKQTNKHTPQQVSAASSSHLTNIFFQEAKQQQY
jgi:hypothetical protein